MAAKRKGVKNRAKASFSKLSNKRLHRLGKQGKLKKEKQRKKNLLKKFSDKNVPKELGDVIQTSLPSVNDPLDPEDLEYYREKDHDLSFTRSISQSVSQHEKQTGKNKKRKKQNADEDEDVEAYYEQTPRKVFARDKNDKEVKHLLPIKTRDKLIPQTMEVKGAQDESAEAQHDAGVTEAHSSQQIPAEPPPPLSSEELFLQRRQKLLARKQTMASLASAIVQNPEENVKKLKELRLMLYEEDPDVFITVRKLAMVSLMELFKDIIPGYRIRAQPDNKQIKMKQETRHLQDYETALLNNYRLYLEHLEGAAKGGKIPLRGQHKHHKKKGYNGVQIEMSENATKVLSEIAVKCLCQMLVNHPHFNYRNNIIAVLIPLMCKKSAQMSDPICEAVKTMFKTDKSGEVSLEIVRLISRILKTKGNRVHPKVLDTFLSLKIKEVYKGEDDKEKKLKHKEKMIKFSRRERKRQKQLEKLEKELLEVKATENKKAKLKLHTEIIQAVFLTYFRILKSENKSPLLPSVLEGLAKFSHLINVDFFGDLFEVLNKLIDSECLTYRETLHCVLTAFTILTGQGSVLNIDPIRFYRHLYKVLLKVHAGSSSDDVAIIVDCLDVVVNKRKRLISEHRILAFIKRLCTLCLQLLPHGTMATLAMCKMLIQTFPRSDLLFDNEMQGSGVYLPELDDPEHCHAQNTAVWELLLLRNHYHPVVRKYSRHVASQAPSTGEGQLPVNLARKTPRELLEEFDLGPMKIDPSIPEKLKQKKKAVRLKGWQQEDLGVKMESVLKSVPDTIT